MTVELAGVAARARAIGGLVLFLVLDEFPGLSPTHTWAMTGLDHVLPMTCFVDGLPVSGSGPPAG